MEPGQIAHINANKTELITYTSANVLLLANLEQVGMLSDIEVQSVNSEKTEIKQAEELYKIMKQKQNGYIPLILALQATNQSGAYNILLNVSAEMVKNSRVGLTNTVNLSQNEVADIVTWANRLCVDERLELHKSILNQKEKVSLWRDTIPEPYALYISRYLTRCNALKQEFFEKAVKDVFVFKDITREELRIYVKSDYAIESSTNYLVNNKTSVRFILLDMGLEIHWNTICKNLQSPTHLLRYERSTQTFMVEVSFGDSTELRQYLKKKDTTNSEDISEDDFVDKIATGTDRGICICDVPGMGKSLFLASIATKIRDNYSNRLVSFIQLRNLKLQTGQTSSEDARSVILKHVTTTKSKFTFDILNKIIKGNKEIKLELFFDGLDEITDETQLNETCTFFKKICESMANARIYVTSRPVVRDKLEESVGVIAYDIVGFNEAQQQEYMLSYWYEKDKNTQLDDKKLKKYSSDCLQHFKVNLKSCDKDIAGIPLQCFLMAEVYSETAISYAGSTNEVPIENFGNSLSDIYSTFILRQLEDIKCNFKCMYKNEETSCDTKCQVRSFHVWKSIQLIFPEIASFLCEKISEFDSLSLQRKLSPGLLEKREDSNSRGTNVEFVHRTFAEYLVAEYFASKVFTELLATMEQKKFQQLVYDQVFKSTEYPDPLLDFHAYRLKEQVVAYFLNVLLTENKRNTMSIMCQADLRICYPDKFCKILIGCMLENSSGLLDVYFKAVKNTMDKYMETEQAADRRDYWIYCWSPGSTIPNEYGWKHILRVATAIYSKETVQKICEFFSNIFKVDLIALSYDIGLKWVPPPIVIAIQKGDLELAKYFAERVPASWGLHEAMRFCLLGTYFECDDLVNRKLDIARMLLEKDNTLLTNLGESYTYLAHKYHLYAIKFLLKAVKPAERPKSHHVIYGTPEYMSTKDVIELCGYVDAEYNSDAKNDFLKPEQLEESLFSNPNMTNHKTELLLNLLQYLHTKSNNANSASNFEENQYMSEVLNTILQDTAFYIEHRKMFSYLFLAAVHEGVTPVVKQLIKYDAITFCVNQTVQIWNRNVPVLFAAGSGEIFQYFVSTGASIFEVDSDGRTVLHFLLEKHQFDTFFEVVKFLGILWNYYAFNSTLFSFLLHSSRTGTTKPTNLRQLFNWPTTDSKETPLHYYIKNSTRCMWHPEMFDLFLKGGNKQMFEFESVVNLHEKDGNGKWVLENWYSMVRSKSYCFIVPNCFVSTGCLCRKVDNIDYKEYIKKSCALKVNVR